MLVNTFYDKVKTDPVIGHIFMDIIGHDWSHHLPVMYSFWETVLLGVPGYTGNAVKRHVDIDSRVGFEEAHFNRWLELWNETVDSLFDGPIAAEARNRAMLMSHLIHMKVKWGRSGQSIV